MIANSETSGPSRNSSITTRVTLRRVGGGFLAVVGHHDALAGGEAVVLHDVRRAERVERGRHLVGCGADVRHRGRHSGRGHHVLGEGLRSLELGGLPRGAEAADAAVADGVGDPGDEGSLGPDDDEVGADLLGQGGHRVAVELVDLVQGGDGRDAGVAGCGVDLLDGRVAGEGQRERVLTAAGADDEDLHAG